LRPLQKEVGSGFEVARLRTDFLFWALFPLQFFNAEFTLPVQEMAWLVKIKKIYLEYL